MVAAVAVVAEEQLWMEESWLKLIGNRIKQVLHAWSSFSLVPQRVQHLHSMHCHGYSFTLMIMFCVNCRHVGWPATKENNTK